MSLTLNTAAATRRLRSNPNVAPRESRQPFEKTEDAIAEFTNAIDQFYPDLDETQADGAQGQKGLVRYRTKDTANQVNYEGDSSNGEYVHEFVGGGFIMTRYNETSIDNFQVGPRGVQRLHLDRQDPSKSFLTVSDESWALGGGQAPAAPDLPPGMVTTPSGLQYAVLKPSTDSESADPGEQVLVHYTGWLADGTQFDSSRSKNSPFRFPLGQGRVIKGWDEGVSGMRAGEKRLLQIPAELAYGDRDRGTIPANSPLTFEVELLATSNEVDG